MRRSLLLLSMLLGWSHAGPAFAGSVITTDLPSNVSIVNINAQQDGAANYNGGSTGQAYWYSPFSTLGAASLLTLPVSPGTYTFSIIDPADAAKAYPSLTSSQLGSIYTAWTYNSPWITEYFVFDISAATNSSIPQLFDGAGTLNSFNNPQSAYDDTVASGFANKIRITSQQAPAQGREGTNFTTSYTVTTATSLVFVIPDNVLSDNNGGVSVVVTQVVPEPGTCALLAVAGLSLAGWRGRQMRRAASAA